MKTTRNEELTNLHDMRKMDLANRSLNYENQITTSTNKLPPVNQQNVAANNYTELHDSGWIKNDYQKLQG